MSIGSEWAHFALVIGLVGSFTDNNIPAFGAAPAFWFILLSSVGLSFSQSTNPYNTLYDVTASAPFVSQITGSWSSHEGSILSGCLLTRLDGFLYRWVRVGQNVKKGVIGVRCSTMCLRLSASPPSIPYAENPQNPVTGDQKTLLLYRGKEKAVVEHIANGGMVHHWLPGAPDSSPVFREHVSSALQLVNWRYRNLSESSVEQRVRRLGLLIELFLTARNDPFVFSPIVVRTDPLAESNPVPQDPLPALHPPCIYAGDVASAFLAVSWRSKNEGRMGCSRSTQTRSDLGGWLLRRSYFGSRINSERLDLPNVVNVHGAAHGLWCQWIGLGACLVNCQLVDTGSAFLLVRNGDLTCSPMTGLCSSKGSDLFYHRFWILTCRLWSTVGILPGSWWAHHELGRGGWWFRDPVENAALIPRVLSTAGLHSVSRPRLPFWTSRLTLLLLPVCLSGTYSIRSGLLAPVHSFAVAE